MMNTHNKSTVTDILNHFKNCEPKFVLELSERVTIDKYAEKLVEKAERIERWRSNELIGLVAFYLNDDKQTAFITNVSVTLKSQRQGIATDLMSRCITLINEKKIGTIDLEVIRTNTDAINLYSNFNFKNINSTRSQFTMRRTSQT